MKKLFVNTESVATFATSFNSQGKRKPAICVGIFYALTYSFLVRILNDIRLLPPCGALMCPLPCEVKDNGKGQPFFLAYNAKIIRFHMAELVIQNSNGNDVTTSLIVAEVFGKNHKDVLRDIERLSCSDDFRVRNFAHTPYTHPQNGQVYHYYEMTKDGFSFLVMGYTGTKAGEFKERFINEFNRREALLKNDDYILMRSQQILQKRLEASEEKIKKLEVEKQAIIEETKPAVVFTECVKNSPTNILVRDLAKLITQNGFKIGERHLYDWLVEKKYLIRHKRWSKSKGKYDNDYTPTQKAAEMFLFFVTENAVMQGGNLAFIKHTCYVTGKGQVYFLNKFKELSKAA